MSALRATGTRAKPRPSIRDAGDVWCWMNTWGNLDTRDLTAPERDGYRTAISDMLRAFDEAGVHASHEAWMRWTTGA